MTSGTTAFFVNAMAPIQKSLNESLAAITRSLEGSRSLAGLLFVMLVSLIYGMFHAAGPGHGKTIVSSFLLANDAKIRHSIIVGYLIAIVHAIAALAVVLILYYLIRGLFSIGVEQADHYIQLVTFGVIAVLGGFMLVARIRGKAHHHHLHMEKENGALTLRSLIGIAIPAGRHPLPRSRGSDPLRSLPSHAGRKRAFGHLHLPRDGRHDQPDRGHRHPRQARGNSRFGGRSRREGFAPAQNHRNRWRGHTLPVRPRVLPRPVVERTPRRPLPT